MKLVLSVFQGRPELVVILMMVTIIAMLMVPLPPWLIDALIAFNMMLAMTIFVCSFYVGSVGEFSSFPTVLLITTVFRLALSITTSRMILLEADAGNIVSSFGEFVIGGNLMVGIVIFAIVTLVQFLVITKGSERVAEVCARFSLDGMPGKQMSIDADLRSEIITGDQARKMRQTLEKESQLYGSLDGAIKFVKGDAIAGIIIIFVNFIGGVSVGMSHNGLSYSDALQTYTVLTIGDGLVSQIPALLISVAAGFIVTRVKDSEEKNLGAALMTQVFGRNDVILPVAGLSILAGFIPGFPTIVFLALAIGLLLLYMKRAGKIKSLMNKFNARQEDQNENLGAEAKDLKKHSTGNLQQEGKDISQYSPETVPIILEMPSYAVRRSHETGLHEEIATHVFVNLGIKIPEIDVRESNSLKANTARLYINEVCAAELDLVFGKRCVEQGMELLDALDIEATVIENQLGEKKYWCDANALENLDENSPIFSLSDHQMMSRQIALVIARQISELFGIQETKYLIDDLEKKYPDLIKEVYRNAPIQRITQVLQRLITENISIRNFKNVLESIAQWAPKERDNIALAENVRGTLGRYITEKFSRGRQINAVVTLPDTEDIIRASVKQNSGGTFLQMSPDHAETIFQGLQSIFESHYFASDDIVLLTSIDTRRFLRVLVEPRYLNLDVLSYGEIADQSKIKIIDQI